MPVPSSSKPRVPGRPSLRRVLLKLSGEVLAGPAGQGLDPQVLQDMARQIAQVHDEGVQCAVVIGGGNFFRGASSLRGAIERVTGDAMGMLATVMNALALRDVLEGLGTRARVFSAVPLGGVAQAYDRRHAAQALEEGEVVFLAAGTGNPFFTTDTAAALRACELDVDLLMKATKVPGVFTADPQKNPDARFLPRVSYQHAIERHLGVMDTTALALCQENHIPIRVFDVGVQGNILRLIRGEDLGTLVSAQAGSQEDDP